MSTSEGQRGETVRTERYMFCLLILRYNCLIYIGVNHPAIVREISHFDVFPALQHFFQNVPHFWLYFENKIFLQIVIIVGARKKLCA